MGLNLSNRDRSVHEICTYTRSSMVIPAAASTFFSLSSKILISSSIFSGAFPVFGSSPIRPARYSVFPTRMPSLNGACTGPPASLIALRDPWGVACENAPRIVKNAATIKTTATMLMRRFILCLPSIDLPAMPREFSTQSYPRQAPVMRPITHTLRPQGVLYLQSEWTGVVVHRLVRLLLTTVAWIPE